VSGISRGPYDGRTSDPAGRRGCDPVISYKSGLKLLRYLATPAGVASMA
jgi:hypothetical protein